MSASSAAIAGRAAATRLMVDRVSLRAPGTTSAWNPANNRTEVTQNAPFATSVPARVRAFTQRGAGSDTVVVDDSVRVTGYIVTIPLDAPGSSSVVADGEKNTLVDVTASIDPLLVGRTLRVVDIVVGTFPLYRKLLCTLND